MGKSRLNIISYVVGFVLILWLIFELIGVNMPYIVPSLLEWITQFILPWIILYWLIRLVKGIEKRNS